MKPRDFLNFFKTKSGKLVLFVAIFGGGLLIFSALRDKSGQRGEQDIRVTRLHDERRRTSRRLCKRIERPMQLFRPPPPKPEPPPPPPKTNEPPKIVVEKPKPEATARSLSRRSVFSPTPAPVWPNRNRSSSIYAPFGRLISCETVITVDSASIQTPIVGLITENIYHAGKLIIPAGTEVHGTAQTDRHRERIASGNSWTLVWQTGEELRLSAIALDREFSGDQEGWGITDGSAGLRGRILKSDNMADIKLFAATFLSGAAGALTEKEQTIFGTVRQPLAEQRAVSKARRRFSRFTRSASTRRSSATASTSACRAESNSTSTSSKQLTVATP